MYSKEWKGLGYLLGTGVIASRKREYRSFKEARKFIRSLNLKNQNDWKEYCKSGNKPDDIPSHPQVIYKKEEKNEETV